MDCTGGQLAHGIFRLGDFASLVELHIFVGDGCINSGDVCRPEWVSFLGSRELVRFAIHHDAKGVGILTAKTDDIECN